MHQYDKVLYVPVGKIKDHPKVPNIRTDLTKASVKEMISSVKEKGVQNPLTVFSENGDFFLISGWRRRKAEIPNRPSRMFPFW